MLGDKIKGDSSIQRFKRALSWLLSSKISPRISATCYMRGSLVHYQSDESRNFKLLSRLLGQFTKVKDPNF